MYKIIIGLNEKDLIHCIHPASLLGIHIQNIKCSLDCSISLYSRLFIFLIILDEAIDGECLSLLTERALEGMVKKVGPRMKILKVIQKMASPSVSNSPNTSSFTDLTQTQTSQLSPESVSLLQQPDSFSSSSTSADEISVKPLSVTKDYSSPQSR